MYQNLRIIERGHLVSSPNGYYWQEATEDEIHQSAVKLQSAVKQRVLYHAKGNASLCKKHVIGLVDFLMNGFSGYSISHTLWDMGWEGFSYNKMGEISFEPGQGEVNRAVTNAAIDKLGERLAKRVNELVQLHDNNSNVFVGSCKVIIVGFLNKYRYRVTPERIEKILDEAKGEYRGAVPFKSFLRQFLKAWRKENTFCRDGDAMSYAIRDSMGRISDFASFEEWRRFQTNDESTDFRTANLSDTALEILNEILDNRLSDNEVGAILQFLHDVDEVPERIDELLQKIENISTTKNLPRRLIWKTPVSQ